MGNWNSIEFLLLDIREHAILVSCSTIFLRAGNNPVVLKNSTEHAETLFIALSEHGWLKSGNVIGQLLWPET